MGESITVTCKYCCGALRKEFSARLERDNLSSYDQDRIVAILLDALDKERKLC